MPSYNAQIHVSSGLSLCPGQILTGDVTYNAICQCELKGAKLQLKCRTRYYPLGRPRLGHRYFLETLKKDVHLYIDGHNLPIRNTEALGQNRGQDKFTFEYKLPEDLLPSSRSHDCRVPCHLEVSYQLVLSSKRGFFGGRRVDSTREITIRPRLNLSKNPLVELAEREVRVQESLLGQGFDVIASAWLPRCGWALGERVELLLDVLNLSTIHVQSQVATLERTIVFMHKRKPLAPLTTDVAQSISRVSSSEGDLRGDPVVTSTLLAVETPNSNFPISGIMYSSDISIHYRIRVDIKSDDPRKPTVTLYLPIILGTSAPKTNPLLSHRAPRNRQGDHGDDRRQEDTSPPQRSNGDTSQAPRPATNGRQQVKAPPGRSHGERPGGSMTPTERSHGATARALPRGMDGQQSVLSSSQPAAGAASRPPRPTGDGQKPGVSLPDRSDEAVTRTARPTAGNTSGPQSSGSSTNVSASQPPASEAGLRVVNPSTEASMSTMGLLSSRMSLDPFEDMHSGPSSSIRSSQKSDTQRKQYVSGRWTPSASPVPWPQDQTHSASHSGTQYGAMSSTSQADVTRADSDASATMGQEAHSDQVIDDYVSMHAAATDTTPLFQSNKRAKKRCTRAQP